MDQFGTKMNFNTEMVALGQDTLELVNRTLDQRNPRSENVRAKKSPRTNVFLSPLFQGTPEFLFPYTKKQKPTDNGRKTVPRFVPGDHRRWREEARQDGDRNSQCVCTTESEVQPNKRHVPTTHHKTRLHPRCHIGASLVHCRLHRREGSQPGGRQDLGGERVPCVPGLPGAHRQGRTRLGARLRVPVASLRGPVRGLPHGLHGKGRGPIGSGGAQVEKHTVRQKDHPECVEPGRFPLDGPPTVSCVCPILRPFPRGRG